MSPHRTLRLPASLRMSASCGIPDFPLSIFDKCVKCVSAAFGELPQAQTGFLTVTGDVGAEPQCYLLVGGAAEVGWIDSTSDRRILIAGSCLTERTAAARPLVNRSRRPAAITKRLPTLPEPVDRGRNGPRRGSYGLGDLPRGLVFIPEETNRSIEAAARMPSAASVSRAVARASKRFHRAATRARLPAIGTGRREFGSTSRESPARSGRGRPC